MGACVCDGAFVDSVDNPSQAGMVEMRSREILEHPKAFGAWISGGLSPSSTAHHLLGAAVLLKTLGGFGKMQLFCSVSLSWRTSLLCVLTKYVIAFKNESRLLCERKSIIIYF